MSNVVNTVGTGVTAGQAVTASAGQAPRRRQRGAGRWSRGWRYAALSLLSILFLFPFYWIVSISLQSSTQAGSLPLTWFPPTPLFSNYINAFSAMPFLSFVFHSLIIVVAATFGAVASAAVCAYGFGRIKFWGRDFWFMVVMTTLMMPYIVTFIPIYIMMKDIGWLGTLWPLIVPAWFGGGPFNIFLIRQFMRGIPMDLEEAARVDGASTFRVFWSVMLPLLKPVLAVAAWYQAFASWGDLLGPLVYLTTQDKWTYTQGLYEFGVTYTKSTLIPYEMSLAVISMVPVLIAFFMLQKRLIQGVNITSGIK
ncbi:MAG TPA: carbohydrate ABC transporter permease [Streptosporangiaceae bacterium]|jgi:multiple sugar transport system permease protein|nr:carbohydrate ABC transporter permease [Streptosporangiaceae bacterium]